MSTEKLDPKTRECRFCGKPLYGFGCLFSESSIHVARGNNDECIYCGSTNYGYGCVFHEEIIKKENKKNDKPIHVHGHGKSSKDGKQHCIYCGKTDVVGSGCVFSPNGKHSY